MRTSNVFRAVVADLGIGRHDERRLVGHALHFWWQLKGERAMPSLADVPFGAGAGVLESRLGPYLSAMTAGTTLEDIRVVHCGQTLAEICGGDTTGALASERLPPSIWEKLGYALTSATSTAKPLLASGRFTTTDGRRAVFRSIVLPLSSDGRAVDNLLCALNSKLAEG